MNPKPFYEGFLPEQDGHRIHYSQYGNAAGEAIVTLHGGPGDQTRLKYVTAYDLTKFHVIAFDQRGCGKSLPIGEIADNTTLKLMSDIERLREQLSIDGWFVAGGSWGSTLALAYAEAHPDRVKGLLLCSVFIARPRDIEWSLSKAGGADKFFPDVWEKRIEFLSAHGATPENAAEVLHAKLLKADPENAKVIAAGVLNWEMNLFSLEEDVSYMLPDDIGEKEITYVKIFLHYEMNHFFLEPDQIMSAANAIEMIPTVMVHGRYDVLCTLDSVYELRKRLKSAELIVLPSSGHSMSAEAGIARRLAFNASLDRWTRNK